MVRKKKTVFFVVFLMKIKKEGTSIPMSTNNFYIFVLE